MPRCSFPIDPAELDAQASSDAVWAVWRHVIRKEKAQLLQELLAVEKAAEEGQCENTLVRLPT